LAEARPTRALAGPYSRSAAPIAAGGWTLKGDLAVTVVPTADTGDSDRAPDALEEHLAFVAGSHVAVPCEMHDPPSAHCTLHEDWRELIPGP
jgi:hypothetical protein